MSLSSPTSQTLFFLRAALLLLALSAGSTAVAADAGDGVVIALADYQGLQAIRHELVDRRGALSSWNGTGIGACSGEWAGIKCVKGRVISITLPWRDLAGRLSERLGQLTSLRRLSIHDNAIAGPIPESIGFLTELRGLYLFNNRFSGTIPASIGLCPALQSVDFSNNLLTGEVPAAIANSTKLYRLNVSHNALSGMMPTDIPVLPSLVFLSLGSNNLSGSIPESWLPAQLQFLELGHNRLNGSIPSSIALMQSLRELDLSGNELTGAVPKAMANLTRLEALDVSHNNLSGEVPSALAKKFSASSFAGNPQLCGYSVSAMCLASASASAPAPVASQSPSPPSRRRLGWKAIIFIIAGVAVGVLLLLLLCIALVCCFIRPRKSSSESQKGKTATAAADADVAGGAETEAAGEVGGKLVHFDGAMSFTADDLLCATAEIMGKSTYGTVYKATLEDGGHVAVKRLREKITKGQKDFEAEVAAVGRLRHTNLLPMRAYYLGPKGEKLLVFDYMPNGSLSAFLHARAADMSVSWAARMDIAKGTARGLSFLHDEASMAHGNLTSSNVLLDEDGTPKISDFGLSRLMTASANSNVLAAAGALGYRAPELSKIKKASPKTDVYSLGVIILELLTGRPPSGAASGMDLPQWVASIVKEEWTNEVFDVELMRDAAGSAGDEMLNTLKLALHCVDPSPPARPEAREVLRQLEEFRPATSSAAGA